MVLTDTDRVELAIPPSLAWLILRSIVRKSQLSTEGLGRANALIGLLNDAAHEPLLPLDHRARSKLERRITRELLQVQDLLVDRQLCEVLWALHEMLRILIECGALSVVAGGAFDRAWTKLQAYLFDDTDQDEGQGAKNAVAFARAEAQGRTLGHRILGICQRRGLYRRFLTARFAA